MERWLRRIWIQVTSDRRRIGALAGCLLLGLLLWARIIIVSNMPRTAVANDPNAASGSATSDGSGSVGGTSAKSSAGAARSSRAVQEVNLATLPGHDPFVISPQYFPKPTQTAELVRDAGKSGAQPAEDAGQIEARRMAQLQAMLAPVRLEASMGETFAVLSGKSYRRGDVIVGAWSEDIRFVLEEVKQRSVILECEGRRFELKMASPGRE